jgi:deoxyribodipyrimidine photolyase
MESILPPAVVRFRRDLRLSDNTAFEAAVARRGGQRAARRIP